MRFIECAWKKSHHALSLLQTKTRWCDLQTMMLFVHWMVASVSNLLKTNGTDFDRVPPILPCKNLWFFSLASQFKANNVNDWTFDKCADLPNQLTSNHKNRVWICFGCLAFASVWCTWACVQIEQLTKKKHHELCIWLWVMCRIDKTLLSHHFPLCFLWS